ncbi:hypothetical protein PSECIP111854_03960 [Pseudoalteromonas sp. CIP111854]|uniref:Aminoglycoside phosphotransferase domain-containing protein n=1 Tax=Pseudoalteromonas holothuriae TaxID=2963714 RepID=A0A9W4R4V6_9GAMM|nr:aminoglycoside phosphotransferase family protein [Pseudoalteromonas sp. CIP111854]CAH9066793.1 hypothetical protein PSECIP111854_03960 [Pseudoalteromonas sp. CIP111854]
MNPSNVYPDLNIRPFATGNSCEVYSWSDKQVLKLYLPTITESHIQHEIRMVEQASDAGLTPLAVNALVQVGSRTGLVFNRIEGLSVKQAVLTKPWRLRTYARLLARQHAKLHQRAAPKSFPLLNDYIEELFLTCGSLPPKTETLLLACLENTPEATRVCHNNVTLLNTLVDESQLIFIDWVDARAGNPDVDVALCWLRLIKAAHLMAGRNRLQRWLLQDFAYTYLNQYFIQRPATQLGMQYALPLAAFILDQVSQSRQFSALAQLMDADLLCSHLNSKRKWI